MPKQNSSPKKPKKTPVQPVENPVENSQSKPPKTKPEPKSKTKPPSLKSAYKTAFASSRQKIWQRKNSRRRLHTSFRRSYREDYNHSLPLPGLVQHTINSLKPLKTHWKTFALLTLLALVVTVLTVGIFSEETYLEFQTTLEETNDDLGAGDLSNTAKASLLLLSTITTGGLNAEMSEVQQLTTIIIFFITFLVVIYLLRHYRAGHRPKLRDALYNALTPLISTFLIALVILIELIPVLLVIITFSAAVATDFLATPFYALVYFIFAALMLLLSSSLRSSSLIALVAVTAPGLYPLTALRTSANLVAGNRIKFIIRLLYFLLITALAWALIMIPIILLDLWLKSSFAWLEGWPIVSVALLIMTYLTFIFFSAYLYTFYRELLAADADYARRELEPKQQPNPKKGKNVN